MRVAVNAEQLMHPSPGGVGRYTAQLLTLMPGRHPDCAITPLTARHSPAEVANAFAAAGIAPEVSARAARQLLPRPLLYEAWSRAGGPPLRLGDRPDVVHAPSVAVPPAGGAPLVVTVHDAAPELFPETFTRHGRAFHARCLALAARRADIVITVSEAAAEEIISHSPIPADRVTVVHNGVAVPDVASDRRDAALGRLGLAGRRYVLWVGSFEPRKGVGTLVAAMAELCRRGTDPEVLTVLAGFDGWLRAGLVAASDEARLGPSLRRLGRVSDGDLWALYAGATVFAFPSRHEGFGLPVVEAMSQGAAVVASDIPALREVAGEGAAMVAPGDVGRWADAIGELLVDERARTRLAERGRSRSRQFGMDRMLDRTWEVYRRAASR